MAIFDVQGCWHINHIVRDYARVADWYREVFAAETVFADMWTDTDKRWASMVTIGDLAIDILQPSVEGADLPMGRTLARLGEHYYLVAYTVDATSLEIWDRLAKLGIRTYTSGGGGRDVVAHNPISPVFTLGEDTAGQIEFMPSPERLPDPSRGYGFDDPRDAADWSKDRWRDQHPLGIEGWYLTVVVADLARAQKVYAAFGARPVDGQLSAGGERAYIALGTATIELLRPHGSASLAARELEANGEIFHAVNFQVRDLGAAQRYLESKGLALVERGPSGFAIDPAGAFGAVLRFTDRGTRSTGPAP